MTGEDRDALLEQLCRATRDLLAGAAAPLRRVRVRAGDMTVELEWPNPSDPPNRPHTPDTAPTPAAGATATGHESIPDGTSGTGQPTDPAHGSDAHFICAPLVGTFYVAPEPGASPFVGPGDLVQPGQQVAIVEAMKLMLPVEADCAGRVIDVLAANGGPVEYGDRLIAVEPIGAS